MDRDSCRELEELTRLLREFARERDWEQFHSPKNLSMALSVEVAEIVEIFQWLTQEESRSLDEEKIARLREEIGDVMIYLTSLAEKFGIDVIDAAKAKVEVNRKRYPVDVVRSKAEKYTHYCRRGSPGS